MQTPKSKSKHPSVSPPVTAAASVVARQTLWVDDLKGIQDEKNTFLSNSQPKLPGLDWKSFPTVVILDSPWAHIYLSGRNGHGRAQI